MTPARASLTTAEGQVHEAASAEDLAFRMVGRRVVLQVDAGAAGKSAAGEKILELEAAAKSTNTLDEIMPLYYSVGALSTNCKKDLENIVEN